MKKVILAIALISTNFLMGCFNYNDINKVIFVTAIGIDIDKENRPIVYAEAFLTNRNITEDKGTEEKTIFKGTGDTIFEAIRNINLGTSYKLNYSQNKAIIFSKRAAEYGLDNFIDILDRDQEFLMRQYMFVTSDDLMDVLNTKVVEENFVGIFLTDLILNYQIQSKVSKLRFDEYLVNRQMESSVDLINFLEKTKHTPNDRLTIKGLAVIQNDKLVGELNPKEAKYYNFFMGTLKVGDISIPHPEYEDKFITLEVIKNRTKLKVFDEGESINIYKTINTSVSFAEAQEGVKISNREERETIEKYAEKEIKARCRKLYEKYYAKDIDIYNLKREISIRYPKEDLTDILYNVNLYIDVNVNLEGSSDVTDFY